MRRPSTLIAGSFDTAGTYDGPPVPHIGPPCELGLLLGSETGSCAGWMTGRGRAPYAARVDGTKTIADATWIAPTTAIVAVVIALAVGLQRDAFIEPGRQTVFLVLACLPW